MATAAAWVLHLGGSLHAAIGMRELVQIVEVPDTYPVPLTPACSRSVVFWQKRMVPVLDLSMRIHHQAASGKLLAIVGYQASAREAVGLGAIILSAPPVRITVDDSDGCALDEEKMALWGELSNSSFKHGDSVMPILHLSRLFAVLD